MKQQARISLIKDEVNGVSQTSGMPFRQQYVLLAADEEDGSVSTMVLNLRGPQIDEFRQRGLQVGDTVVVDLRSVNRAKGEFINMNAWVKGLMLNA